MIIEKLSWCYAKISADVVKPYWIRALMSQGYGYEDAWAMAGSLNKCPTITYQGYTYIFELFCHVLAISTDDAKERFNQQGMKIEELVWSCGFHDTKSWVKHVQKNQGILKNKQYWFVMADVREYTVPEISENLEIDVYEIYAILEKKKTIVEIVGMEPERRRELARTSTSFLNKELEQKPTIESICKELEEGPFLKPAAPNPCSLDFMITIGEKTRQLQYWQKITKFPYALIG